MSCNLPLLGETIDDSKQEFKHARRDILLHNYDPFAYPPDLRFAQEHGLAQSVGKHIAPQADVDRCRCCLEPLHKVPLSLTCDLEELAHCGQSVPLYFLFSKQALILLLLNILIVAIPSTIINLSEGGTCQMLGSANEWVFSVICSTSVLNIMDIEAIDWMQVEAICNFLSVMGSLLAVAYFQVALECRVMVRGARSSDYSILLKGLPKDLTVNEIQKFVEDKLLYIGVQEKSVVKIYVIYDLKTYQALWTNKREAVEEMVKARFERAKYVRAELSAQGQLAKSKWALQQRECSDRIDQLQNKIELIDIEIGKFEECMNSQAISLCNDSILEAEKSSLRFSGRCIITLDSRKSKELLVQSQGQRSLLQWLGYKINLLLEGKKASLVILAAPEPSDIIFSNMGSHKRLAWKSKLIYSSLIVLILALDMALLTLAKKFLKEEKNIQDQSIVFSCINSMLVAICCSFLRRIITSFEQNSYHGTTSQLNHAIVWKMVGVFLINMLLTTFLANVASFYLIKEDKPTFPVFPLNFESFLLDVFFLLATNPFFTLVVAFFDHRQITKLLKRYRIQHGLPVTQTEANLTFQNMNLDLSYRYSTVFRFLIFTAGVAPIFPLALVLCAAALGVFYWTDKALLLRRFSIGRRIGSHFSILNQHILGQFPLYFAAANFLIMFIPVMDGKAFEEEQYSKLYYYSALVALIVSAVTYFVGNGWIRKILRRCIEKGREGQTDSFKFREIQGNLDEDYSHHYPYFRVSQQVKKENESVRNHKLEQLRQNQTLGVFEILRSYIDQKRYAPQ